MRTEKRLEDRVVFEESDFQKLNLKFVEPIGQFSVLSMGETQRYVVQVMITKERKKEYHVLCSYQLNYTELDKLRKGGAL